MHATPSNAYCRLCVSQYTDSTTLSTEKGGMSYRVEREKMSGTRVTVERMNRKIEKKKKGAKREIEKEQKVVS